jgi:outer membrane lipoprotein SlyB
MNRLIKASTLGLLMLGSVAACTNPNDPGQRAVGGGLLGAGAGAALGAAVGGGHGAAVGALVGGAAGAATGYATTPQRDDRYRDDRYRDDRYYPPPPPPGY